MRRKQPRVGVIVGAVVCSLLALSLIVPAVTQNLQVRKFFTGYFTLLRDKDIPRLRTEFFSGRTLLNTYTDQLTKYPLQGWKITRLSGQPYPIESARSSSEMLYADLYYQLPNGVKLPGTYRKITHPQYGPCFVVPVTLEYSYHPNEVKELVLEQPDYQTGENWAVPFEKALPH